MLNIRSLTCNPLQERAYVAWREPGRCVVVDPGCYGAAERQALEAVFAQEKLTPEAVLLTHAHFDHIYGVKALQERYGIPVYMHPADESQLAHVGAMPRMLGMDDPATDFDRTPLAEGPLQIAGMEFEVIATPGHTPGSVCYIFDGMMFTGDTLFKNSIGTTPLGGDEAQLMRSLRALKNLPGDYDVYPGHDAFTTLSDERRFNPYLRNL